MSRGIARSVVWRDIWRAIAQRMFVNGSALRRHRHISANAGKISLRFRTYWPATKQRFWNWASAQAMWATAISSEYLDRVAMILLQSGKQVACQSSNWTGIALAQAALMTDHFAREIQRRCFTFCCIVILAAGQQISAWLWRKWSADWKIPNRSAKRTWALQRRIVLSCWVCDSWWLLVNRYLMINNHWMLTACHALSLTR